MSYNYLFRIILLGDSGVGKSTLRQQLSHKALETEPTIGIDFASVITKLPNDIIVKTHIWDTAGQEFYGPIIKSYYRNIAGAIFIFDLTNKESFTRIKHWIQQLIEQNEKPGQFALIGNKNDLERNVDFETASTFAKDHNMMYSEISALQNKNITSFFYEYIATIYHNMKHILPDGIKKGDRYKYYNEEDDGFYGCCPIL